MLIRQRVPSFLTFSLLWTRSANTSCFFFANWRSGRRSWRNQMMLVSKIMSGYIAVCGGWGWHGAPIFYFGIMNCSSRGWRKGWCRNIVFLFWCWSRRKRIEKKSRFISGIGQSLIIQSWYVRIFRIGIIRTILSCNWICFWSSRKWRSSFLLIVMAGMNLSMGAIRFINWVVVYMIPAINNKSAYANYQGTVSRLTGRQETVDCILHNIRA